MEQPEPIYVWSQLRIPTLTKNVTKTEIPSALNEIENLYIDLTEIIIKILSKQQFQTIKGLFKPITIFLEDRILKVVNPKKMIFFAYDGTIPACLFQKQYQRMADLGILEENGSFLGFHDLIAGSSKLQELEKFLNDKFIKLVKDRKEQNEKFKIIFSGSQVPGDAQFKISEFIRKQRSQPNYDPNTSHCIVSKSSEAFLIALSSHEYNMFVLNCDVLQQQQLQCLNCYKKNHTYNDCEGKYSLHAQPHQENKIYNSVNSELLFQLYDFKEFREFLNLEFKFISYQLIQFDLENIIDDFCFIIILLEIVQIVGFKLSNSLDCLIYLYKRMIPFLSRYIITPQRDIDLKILKIFLTKLAESEEAMIKNFVRVEYFQNKSFSTGEMEKKNWYAYCTELQQSILTVFNHNQDQNIQYNNSDENNIFFDQQSLNKNFQFVEQPNSYAYINQLFQYNLQETMIETGKSKEELIEEQLLYEQQQQQQTNNNNHSGKKNQDQTKDVDQYLKSEQYPKILQMIIQSQDQVHNEVILDYSKYPERFLEGISSSTIYETPQTDNDDEFLILQQMNNMLEKQGIGEYNYKADYYKKQFNFQEPFQTFFKNVREQQLKHIYWRFFYFYHGYLSWSFQYEYNSPIFVSDLIQDIDKQEIKFDKGVQLKPLEFFILMTSSCCNYNNNLINQIPQIYSFLLEEKCKDEIKIGQKFVESLNWNFEKRIVSVPPSNLEKFTSLTAQFEQFLNEAQQKLNSKGKILLYTNEKLQLNQVGIFKNFLNQKQHFLTGEIFIEKQQFHNNEGVHVFGFLPPQTTSSISQFQLLPGIDTLFSQPEHNIIAAELYDKVIYRDNILIRFFERLLTSIKIQNNMNSNHRRTELQQQHYSQNNFQKKIFNPDLDPRQQSTHNIKKQQPQPQVHQAETRKSSSLKMSPYQDPAFVQPYPHTQHPRQPQFHPPVHPLPYPHPNNNYNPQQPNIQQQQQFQQQQYYQQSYQLRQNQYQ